MASDRCGDKREIESERDLIDRKFRELEDRQKVEINHIRERENGARMVFACGVLRAGGAVCACGGVGDGGGGGGGELNVKEKRAGTRERTK